MPRLEDTEVSICERCPKRFECYTNRDNFDGLCVPQHFENLNSEIIRQIQIAKAKRQGHYVVGGKDEN